MNRVTGIRGIFFKAKDPKKLRAWYGDHLGLQPHSEGGVEPAERPYGVEAVFKDNSGNW